MGLEGVTNFGESPNFLDMACLAKTQKSQFFGHGHNPQFFGHVLLNYFNLYLRLGEHPQNKPKVELLRRLFEIDERTSAEKKSIEFVESKELYEYILLQKF